MVAPRSPNRLSLSVEFVAASVIAGNTGLIYGKFGSAPNATIVSNSWDFVLNPGSIDGTNQNQNLPKAPNTDELYLISDTAGQVVNVVERYLDGTPPTVTSVVVGS